MIFALATDDWGLMAFPSISEAVAYCERIDVEGGGWLFFAEDGAPLEVHFSKPSTGSYFLRPASVGKPLKDHLSSVRSVEGEGLSSVADVTRVLSGA